MKTIIYSAIYGDYDKPKKHLLKEKPVLFTDSIESEDWEVRKVERKEVHPRMQAKYFKCMPHEVLGCDVSVWIDGSVAIKTPNFEDWCLKQLGDSDIALFRHPDRSCIYIEADFCKDMPKYRELPIMEQVQEYETMGYPKNAGLWACTVMIRRHNKKVEEFNKLWWEHNNKYTYQDQLSFPVCAKQVGLKINTIEGNLWNNEIISDDTSQHKSDL